MGKYVRIQRYFQEVLQDETKPGRRPFLKRRKYISLYEPIKTGNNMYDFKILTRRKTTCNRKVRFDSTQFVNEGNEMSNEFPFISDHYLGRRSLKCFKIFE